MPTFVKLTKDDQDSVRLLTVEDILKTTSILTMEESKQHLLPILKTLGQDKSWRVRSMVATHYAEVSRQGSTNRKDSLFFVAMWSLWYFRGPRRTGGSLCRPHQGQWRRSQDHDHRTSIRYVGWRWDLFLNFAFTRLFLLLAFAQLVDEMTVVDKLIPCIKDLVIDTNQQVRAAVASNISALAPIFGKDV